MTSNGRVILIETLKTGHEQPHPSLELVEYYEWLETTNGFTRQWIRTDYVFDTVEIAAQTAGAFFGPRFAAQVREHQWSRIPECTGIWARQPDQSDTWTQPSQPLGYEALPGRSGTTGARADW